MADMTINDYDPAVTIDASADYYLLEQGGVYKRINRNVGLGLTSAPLGTTDSQSPQNKTFDNTNSITVKDGSLTIQNSSSTTKQAVFSAASITAGQTRTFTFPDASGTLATIAGTQTLTNKTLTSPTITGGSIDNTTITVDSISGHTSGTVVTVANMQVSNGVINTANAVTATSIAAGAVQPQALVSGTGSGWAWQSYTPTYSNLSGGTTNAANYIQIGKTVFVRWQYTLAGAGVGTDPSVTLPVTPASGQDTTGSAINGSASLIDTGVAYYAAKVVISASTFKFLINNASGTWLTQTNTPTATQPFTFGASDILSASFCYEAQ